MFNLLLAFVIFASSFLSLFHSPPVKPTPTPITGNVSPYRIDETDNALYLTVEVNFQSPNILTEICLWIDNSPPSCQPYTKYPVIKLPAVSTYINSQAKDNKGQLSPIVTEKIWGGAPSNVAQ